MKKYLGRHVRVRSMVALMGMAAIGCATDAGLATSPLIDPPAPVMPTDGIVASTSAGALEGSLDVSETGTATYTLPLDVPDGREGMQPSLALTYDSGAGNGPFGVGFSLAGTPSSIRRCANPEVREGTPINPGLAPGFDEGSVTFTNDGRSSFCWGAERLIPVTEWSAASTAVELRPWASPDVRVRAFFDVAGEITSFWADLPNGHQLKFERQVAGIAFVTDSAGVRASVGSRVLSWALTRDTDASGNHIDYQYTTAITANGTTHELSQIDYTGFGATLGLRSVRFVYEVRTDPMTGYQDGIALSQTNRVKRIEMWGPDVDNVIRRHWYYRLDYRNDTITTRSVLSSVRQCDAWDVCNPPAVFEWEVGSDGVTAGASLGQAGGQHAVADMDGDGFDELLVGPFARGAYQGPLGTWQRMVLSSFGVSTIQDLGIHTAPAVVDPRGTGRHQLLGGVATARSCTPSATVVVPSAPYFGNCWVYVDQPAYAPYVYVPNEYEFCSGTFDTVEPSPSDAVPYHPGTRDGDPYNDRMRCWRNLDPDGDGQYFGVPELVQSTSGTPQWYVHPAAANWHIVQMRQDVAGLVVGSQQVAMSLIGFDPLAPTGGPIRTGLDDLIPGNFAAFTTLGSSGGDAAGDNLLEMLRYTTDAFPMLSRVSLAGSSPAGLALSDFGPPVDYPSRNLRTGPGPAIPGDFTGDGFTDLLVPAWTSPAFTGSTTPPSEPEATYRLLRFRADGSAVVSRTTIPAPQRPQLALGQDTSVPVLPTTLLTLDVNGDGLVDVVDVADANGGGFVAVYFNEGTGFRPKAYLEAPYHTALYIDGGAGVAREIRAIALDWDMDGRGDFAITIGDTFPRLYVSRGNSFVFQTLPFATDTGLHSVAVPAGAAALWRRDPVVMLDFSGDGVQDFVVGESLIPYERKGRRPDRLKAVSTVPGVRSQIGYGLVRDALFGSACVEPFPPKDGGGTPFVARRCASLDMSVVVSLTEPTQVGTTAGSNVHNYAYGYGEYDEHGAFLGFGATRHIDNAAGTTEEVFRTFSRREIAWASGGLAFVDWRNTSQVQSVAEVTLSATEARGNVSRPVGNNLVISGSPTSVFRTPTSAINLGALERELPRGSNTRTFRGSRSTWDAAVGTTVTQKLGWAGTGLSLAENSSSLLYDDRGFPEVTEESGGGITTRVTRTRYDDPYLYFAGATSRETTRSITSAAPRERVVQYEYESGHLAAIVREPDVVGTDPDGIYLRVEIARNSYGQPIKLTLVDAIGNVRLTQMTYDMLDSTHLASIRNPLGHLQWIATHPTLGVPLVTVDPNGRHSRFFYDRFGRIRQVRLNEGGVMNYAYGLDASGRTTYTQSMPSGGSTTTTTDNLGRPSQTSTQLLNGVFTSSVSYDALGNVAEAVMPRLSTSTTAPTIRGLRTTDVFGRLTQASRRLTTSTGAVWTATQMTATYDDLSVTFSDVNSTTRLLADTRGRIHQATDVVGTSEYDNVIAYGEFGLPTRTTDELGSVTSVISYDVIGRPSVVSDQDRGTRVMHYNAFGDILSVDDPMGTTAFDRDQLGRPTAERRTEAGITTTVATMVWDTALVGALESATVPGGATIKFGYDPNGRLIREERTIAGVSYVVQRTYDIYGRLATLVYPVVSGPAFTLYYRYDATSGVLNRIDSCSGTAGCSTTGASTVRWERSATDGLGRTTTEARGATSTTRAYNDLTGAPQSVQTRSSTAALLQDWWYESDAEGKLSLRQESVVRRRENYTYDSLDRLTRWQVRTGTTYGTLNRTVDYGYSPVGNFTQVNSKNELTGVNVTEVYGYPLATASRPHAATQIVRTSGSTSATDLFTYDAAGRQRTGPGRSIDYNHYDLPTRVVTPSGTTTYQYDALHTRTRRVGPAESTVYVGELYERRQVGTSVQHVYYVHGPDGLIAQVSEVSAARTTQYLHDDGAHSVSLATNATGSTVSMRQWFDPFGQRINVTDGSIPGPMPPTSPSQVIRGFTEHRQEDALGLIDMRGRFYDPRMRQFLSADPLFGDVLSSQATHPYSYVHNRAPNAWDPTGFQELPWRPCAGVPNCENQGSHPPDPNEVIATDHERHFVSQDSRQSASAPTSGTQPGSTPTQVTPQQFTDTILGMTAQQMADVGTGALRYVREHGIEAALTALALGMLESAPVANFFATLYFAQALVTEIVDNWDKLQWMAVRFVTGTATTSDREHLGGFLVSLVVAARARTPGRAIGGQAAAVARREVAVATNGAGVGVAASGFFGALLRPLMPALNRLTRERLVAAAVQNTGGVSAAGRALQSHASRPGSWLAGRAGGNNQANTRAATAILTDLLERGQLVHTESANFGPVIEVRFPNGAGARWSADGAWIGFLEARRGAP